MTKDHRFAPENLIALALLSPLYALYGLYLVVRSMVRAWRKAKGLRQAVASEIRCPNGHPNPTVGRFECASCKAVYHGWVGRCAMCGAGAAWIPCDVCGVAIALPWER